jgi:hypothetical protein
MIHNKMTNSLKETTGNYIKIPILKSTFEKMKAYARIADASEVYGFLVAPNNSDDGIVRGALLAPNQFAGGASAGLESVDVGQVKADMENQGLKALGFWHSHGHFSVFHSGTDNRNGEDHYMSFAVNNEERIADESGQKIYIDEGMVVFHNGKIEICVKSDMPRFESRPRGKSLDNMLGVLTDDFKVILKYGENAIIIPDAQRIEVRKAKTGKCRIVGAAYSIVVNSRGEHYAEMAVNKWCGSCERDETEVKKQVDLEIIADGKASFDEDKLAAEIKQKVRGYGGRRTWGLKGIIGRG